MGQCVFSSSGCREDDKALCAVPTPRKLLAALLFPSLLPLPSSQQCTIDSSFQLAAKASRSWIMKWSCGKKKLNREAVFMQSSPRHFPVSLPLAHAEVKTPAPFSCCLHVPAQICTPLLSPPQDYGSESSTLREESACGAPIKRAFAFSSCASAPWEEIHANTRQCLIPS